MKHTLHTDPATNSVILLRDGNPLFCPFQQPTQHVERTTLTNETKVHYQPTPCGNWCPLFNDSAAYDDDHMPAHLVELFCGNTHRAIVISEETPSEGGLHKV